MFCGLCQSRNQAEFTTEMIIHFEGIKNIDHPGVLTFPRVSVCLDCGSSQFIVSEPELAQLAKRTVTNLESISPRVPRWGRRTGTQ